MNKLVIFLLALAAVLSCSKGDGYVPGERDPEGCYKVYFPEQGGYGSILLRPSAERVLTYRVARQRTDGAIVVPVRVEASSAFSVDPISFADGEAETTFSIRFPDIPEQEEVAFSMVIDDPAYVSKYDMRLHYLSFSVLVGTRKIVLNRREDWVFQYYSGYYYVNEADGYYGFRTVPASEGDPEDEAFVQSVVDSYNSELEEHYATAVPNFLSDYSTAQFALFQGAAHYGPTPKSSGAGSSGDFIAFMFGVTSSPYCNGDYQYIILTVE